jgi:YggT family protein
VDVSGVDFLVLIPIFLLILVDGLLKGLLVPQMSLGRGILESFWRSFNFVFQVYVVLILIFSVFYKYARYPANLFIRTGFKIMEPVYSFIGRVAPPLKNWPGVSAFFMGLLIHFSICFVAFLLLSRITPFQGGKSMSLMPGLPALTALMFSLDNLLKLATFFTWMIIIGALMSWVSPDPRNPIVELIRLLSEPINRPFRRIIPSIGGIDISPIFSILALQLVAQLGARLLANIFIAVARPV